MIQRITTKSGSVYEIDIDARRVRRLTGKLAPTQRMGEDELWKDFVEASNPELGHPLTIVWALRGPIAESTVTSPVISIDEAPTS